MPDEIVEIAIRTTADTSGAQETASALNQTSQATSNLTGKSDEGAKKLEFLSLKTGDLRKLIRELGREFPVAGMAARAMMNPILATFSAAITIFGAAKAALAEWNAAMDEAAQRNAGRDLLPGIEAKAKALQESAAAAATFALSLDDVAKKEDAFSGKIKAAVDKLHEFITAQAEVNNASEAKELASVNLQQKLGRITEAQAIEQRAAIKEHYRQIGDDLKTQTENQELALKQQQLKHANEVAPGLEAEALSKRQTADTLKGRLAAASADLPAAKKRLEEYQSDLDKKLEAQDAAQAELDRLQAGGPGSMGLGTMGAQMAQDRLNKATADAEAARAARDRAQGLVSSYETDISQIPQRLLPGAESAASIAEARARANAGNIVSLGTQVGDLQGALPIRQQGRAQAGQIRDQTTQIDAAKDLADELEKGQRKQETLQAQIARLIQSNGQVSEATLNALQAVIDDNLKLKAQLDSDVQRLTQQMSGMRMR